MTGRQGCVGRPMKHAQPAGRHSSTPTRGLPSPSAQTRTPQRSKCRRAIGARSACSRLASPDSRFNVVCTVCRSTETGCHSHAKVPAATVTGASSPTDAPGSSERVLGSVHDTLVTSHGGRWRPPATLCNSGPVDQRPGQGRGITGPRTSTCPNRLWGVVTRVTSSCRAEATSAPRSIGRPTTKTLGSRPCPR